MITFYKYLLIVSGLAFVIQSIAGFIGFDDMDSDDGGFFGFFTLRNLIAFLLGFSSVGYLALSNNYSEAVAVIGGVCFGIFLMGTVIYGMRMLMKLQQRNRIEEHEYRWINATVVVKIEPGGTGKVEFMLNNRIDEMLAVTDGEETLLKGSQVQVVKLLDNNTLLVRKILVI